MTPELPKSFILSRVIAAAVVAGSALALGALVAVITGARTAGLPQELLVLVVITVLGAWLAGRFLVPLSKLPSLPDKVAAVPVTLLGTGTAVFASGVGPLFVHQLAWGLTGIVMAFFIVAKGGVGKAVPLWLAVMLGALLVLQPVEGSSLVIVFDLGIVGIALLVAWNVASSRGGSVVRFLSYVAIAYWVLTIVAVIIVLTHVSVGSMKPDTITAPWAAGLNENYRGYGFITTQAGRMLTAIVGIYHLVRFRFAPKVRILHGVLAIASAALFLTEYGRIPLIGAIVALGIAVVLLLSKGRVAAMTSGVAIIGAVLTIGLLTAGTNSGAFSLRLGTYNWDSGHLVLWNQQLSLFMTAPVAGVSIHPSSRQLYEASLLQIIPTNTLTSGPGLTPEALAIRGSRGEGGWTGLLAQYGIVGASILLSLLGVGARGLIRRDSAYPPELNEDRILLKALLPASFVWYLTDIQIAGFTTFTEYVVLQLSMFAVAIELSRRRRNVSEPGFMKFVDQKDSRP